MSQITPQNKNTTITYLLLGNKTQLNLSTHFTKSVLLITTVGICMEIWKTILKDIELILSFSLYILDHSIFNTVHLKWEGNFLPSTLNKKLITIYTFLHWFLLKKLLQFSNHYLKNTTSQRKKTQLLNPLFMIVLLWENKVSFSKQMQRKRNSVK